MRIEQHYVNGRAEESGVAIILSLVFVLIVGGLVTSGTILMRSSHERSEVQFRVEGQATQFARSGLTEALNWFRRQTAQPVSSFAPRRDTSADPQVLETDDPDIGLVREFQIQGDVWGRYEVWKKWDADPQSDRLAWRQQFQAVDLSSERGFAGAGHVWRIRSIGYVFKRRDENLGFNERPNRVLASVILESEIQRLALQPPGQSAVCIADGALATVGNRGKVLGGPASTAFLFPDDSAGVPTLEAGSVTDGSPVSSPVAAADYKDDAKAVFGVRLQELRAMADQVITNAADFPNPIPNNTILFGSCGDLTFAGAKGLNGTAAVYIQGNVTIQSGSNSSFSGLLYVDGNLTIREPAELYGAVIVTGTFDIRGSGDFATMVYDDDVLATLRTEVGQYRWSTAIREADQ